MSRAIRAVFFLNGLMMGTYIVRVPSLKVQEGLSTTQLGLMATLFAAAALVAMQFVGGLVARVGSGPLIRVGLVAMPLVLAAVGSSHGYTGLMVASAALGAVHGTIDVGMNAHAVAVERTIGRPVLSGCHAAWSLSVVAAALLGSGVIAGGVSLRSHLTGVAGLALLSGLVVGRHLLPATVDRRRVDLTDLGTGPRLAANPNRAPGRPPWTWSLVGLGMTGFAVMVCEGVALSWGGVFLHDHRGASLALASAAVLAFTLGQAGGRLVGDRLTLRYGPVRLFRAGALVATAGFAVALLAPHPLVAVVGFTLAGLGGSPLLPLTFSAAGHAGGSGQGAATFVARLTTFTYTGILLGPAVIGWAAAGIGLQWTLLFVLPVYAATALITRLPTRPELSPQLANVVPDREPIS